MNSAFKRVATVASIVLPMALSGCGGGGASSSTDELKVGIYPNLINNFDYHVADAQGYFEDEGLKVEPITINTGPDMVSALVSGTIDIGDQSTPTVLPVMTKQGQDIDLLYGGLSLSFLMISGSDVDVPAASTDLSAVRALEGKTIGVTAAGALTDWWARALFTEAGMDPDEDVKIVTTGGTSTLVPALQSGKVDAAVIWNTDRSRVGDEGTDYKVVASVLDGTASDAFDGIMQEYYAASHEFIESNRDKVSSYCTAISQAWDWAVDPANEAEVVPMLAEWVQIPEDAAATLWEQERERFIRQVDESTWQQQEALLADGAAPGYDESVDAECNDMFQAG